MDKKREQTIVIIAVAVASVIILFCLAALFLGLFAGPRIGRVISSTPSTGMGTTGGVTAVSTPTPPEVIEFEADNILLTQDEMIETAAAIFAGEIIHISPTQFNQDSGDYWEVTTTEGAGLETTHSAWPVFFVEISVEQKFVDEIGLGETAVLTLLGKSPVDATDPINMRGESVQIGGDPDWSFQVGDEIIAFINETEMGWWDGRPPRQEPMEGGGIAFDYGRRSVLNFANMPETAYLLRDENGRYASLPSVYEQWPPMTLEEVANHIATFRSIPVAVNISATPQITPSTIPPQTAENTTEICPTDSIVYLQNGLLMQLCLFNNTKRPFPVAAQGNIQAAVLDGNGRFLAFTDSNGLNLHDLEREESRLWLASSTEPWEQFQPRTWGSNGNLLLQRIWETGNSAPVRINIDEDSWHHLPLPDDTTADFYSNDSGASWSPDDKQLVLGGYDYAMPSNVPGLTIVNLESNTAQQIVPRTVSPGIENSNSIIAGVHHPRWSHDSAWLAFGLEDNAVAPLNFPIQLYLIRSDGSELTPITMNTQGQATHPIWTNGDNLFYSLNNVDDSEDGIYFYDLASQSTILLIAGNNLAPVTLSKNEQHLVYSQTRISNQVHLQDLYIWSVVTGQSTIVAEGQDGKPARFVGWLSPPNY